MESETTKFACLFSSVGLWEGAAALVSDMAIHVTTALFDSFLVFNNANNFCLREGLSIMVCMLPETRLPLVTW